MEHEFRLKAIQGFGWNHANKLAEYGILYVFSLVLARFLGAEEYGVYSVVISVISLLLVISSIGFDQALNKFVAQLSEPRQIEQLRFLVRRLGLIRLGSHVLLSGGLLVFRYQISVLFKNDGIAQYLEIMSLYILFKGMGDFLANVFIGKLETKIVFIVNTVNRVLLLAVGTFLLTGGFGLFEVLVVFAGVSGLTFLIFLIKSKSQIFGREAYLPLSSVFSFAAANWLFLIVGIGLGRYSDMVLLGGIKGAGNETGFYDLAYSLTMAIEFVFAMGFMGVVLSVFSKLAHSDPAKLSVARVGVIQYQQALILPAGVFCLFHADAIIVMLVSSEFVAVIPMFQAFLGFKLASVVVIGGGVNSALLLSLGKERVSLMIRSVAGALNVAVNYLVIPFYGALGALCVTGAFMVIATGLEFVSVSKIIGARYDWVFLLKVVLVCCAAVGVSSVIPSETISLLTINALCYVVVIGAGYYTVKLLNTTPQFIKAYINDLFRKG